MKFEKIDRNSSATQDFLIIDEISYDLKSKITLSKKGSKTYIDEIEIEIFNEYKNIYQLESALICDKVFKNNKSFYLLWINMLELKKGETPSHKKVILQPKNLTLDSGTLLFTNSFEYKSSSEEKKMCKDIDVFKLSFNPDSKNGNVVVGQP